MDKDLAYYLGLPYTIELIPEPQGGWYAGIKELPGCMTEADTPEEALDEIRQLQAEWLQISLEDGQAIPEPRPEEEYSGNFRLRIPRSLHRKLVQEAGREGVSLNALCSSALAEALGAVTSRPQSTRQPVSGIAPFWPGLSDAVHQILLSQGANSDVGQIDERLFAEWVGQKFHEIANHYRQGDFEELFADLHVLTRIFQQNAWRSSTINLLVQISMLLNTLMEDAQRREQDAIEEAQLLSQLHQVLRKNQRRRLGKGEVRAIYTHKSMAGELTLQDALFGAATQVMEND